MVWIKIRDIMVAFFVIFGATHALAQESLWKTFNSKNKQEVVSYNGGFSPFPQKQKEVEEVNFQPSDTLTEVELVDNDIKLTEEEKRMIKTTAILVELKRFLDAEDMFVPDLRLIVIEAIAKSTKGYKALMFGRWLKKGDNIKVPINEATQALEYLEELRELDVELAETIEGAVLERAREKGQELIEIFEIEKDKIIFKTGSGDIRVINFMKSPF
ncbi:MAG: hypothetical protein GY793_09450 [Proteobacteria bacterium]|nr:hypothetical protein [Pseudomonadota bacterium]